MKKLVLVAFSVLLLVPVGVHSVFANHPMILGCVPPGELNTDPDFTAFFGNLNQFFDVFCQHSPQPIVLNLVCPEPYELGSISNNNSPLGGFLYFACVDTPIQVEDTTHPNQCQGAAILINNHCFAEALSSMIGGELLDIDTMALFVGAIGVNPVITGLVALTMGGIAAQAMWFFHQRRIKNE